MMSYADFSSEYIAVTSDSDGCKLLMGKAFFDYWSGDQREGIWWLPAKANCTRYCKLEFRTMDTAHVQEEEEKFGQDLRW